MIRYARNKIFYLIGLTIEEDLIWTINLLWRHSEKKALTCRSESCSSPIAEQTWSRFSWLADGVFSWKALRIWIRISTRRSNCASRRFMTIVGSCSGFCSWMVLVATLSEGTAQ